MADRVDIPLQGLIFSTPAICPPPAGAGNLGPLFALIRGFGDGTDQKETALDLVDAKGRSQPGFPFLRHGAPYRFAPASQVGVGSPSKGTGSMLIAVDLEGRLWTAVPGSGAPHESAVADDARGWLAAQPLTLPGARGDALLLLVSRAFPPYTGSRNAVHLLDWQGRPRTGWPVPVTDRPVAGTPAIAAGRIHVLLENGSVYGIDVASGQASELLSPDPSLVLAAEPRMAFFPPLGGPVVSVGDARLMRMNARGAAESMRVAGAGRITALAAAGNRLFALDEGRGSLLTLDAAGRIVSRLELGPPSTGNLASLRALDLGGTVVVVTVLVPAQDVDDRISAAFEEHADDEAGRLIAELAAETAQRDFGTSRYGQMTPAQRRTYDADILAMKHSWLQNNLGWDESEAQVAGPPQTRVVISRHDTAGEAIVLADQVPGFTPETGLGMGNRLEPAVQRYGDGCLVALPLNRAATGQPAAGGPDSLVRVYILRR